MTVQKGLLNLKPIKTLKSCWNSAGDDEEVVEPLSPGARVFHAPQLNCFIIAEMGCKTSIDVEVVKEGAKQTLLKHPRFCSKLMFDDSKAKKPLGWVRTKVNVDDHVIVPDVDPNMDSPDQFVEDYMSNITKTPMDFSKPLWEVHILHIKTSNGNSVAIFRIHHSIGDGVSLISLLLACTRQTSDPEALPTLPTNKKKTNNILKKSSFFGFLRCFFWILLFFKVLWNTIVDLILFLATMVCLKDSKTPLKGSPGNECNPRRFVHRMVSLDDIKMVKNDMDMTINDVLVGMTQAGLSRYLNRSYGNARGDGKSQENNLPKKIRMRATLLVNLRPTTTIEDLARMMEKDSKGQWAWGNSIGYILLPFHIGLKDDPLDYFRDAKATVDRKKLSLEAPSTYGSAKYILKLLGLKVIASLTYNVLSNTTMSFSNVVGPTEEISFHGHPMTYLAPSVYGHPQALTIHFQSYMDQMTMVLAVDEDVIPDPHRLCDDIAESLRLAKNAIIERQRANS